MPDATPLPDPNPIPPAELPEHAREPWPESEADHVALSRADYHRARAAVNHCRGVKTADLQTGPTAAELRGDARDMLEMTDALASILLRIGDLQHLDTASPLSHDFLLAALGDLAAAAREGLA